MKADECPFCGMGQVKRIFIFRLANDLSRGQLLDLLSYKKIKGAGK